MIQILQRHVDEAVVVKTRVRNYMVRFANNEITAFKSWDVWLGQACAGTCGDRAGGRAGGFGGVAG
ncbi:MAG: hypothetical protein ACO2PM_06035 [Pyrobaculum sp.]